MMDAKRFEIKLWGCRGSLPVSGPEYHAFGGNTICFELRCGPNVILFDAGSGIYPAGTALKAAGATDFTLFFSHWHYDHVVGLPFFVPLYDSASRLRVFSGHMPDAMSTRQMFSEFMRPPFFPIGPDKCCANIDFNDFRAGDVLSPHDGVTLRTGLLNHPGNAVGYRIEFDGRVIAIITDTEHEEGQLDPTVLDLIRDADLVLYDATFEDAEMDTYRGFGHSTWEQGLRLATAAGVKRIGFVHHSVTRSDAELEVIEQRARAAFPGAFCGHELQVISV
jgi:phosphoribosyl 1,2-cyclic phosphodiesterase